MKNKDTAHFKEVSLPHPEPGIRLIRHDPLDTINRRMDLFRHELNDAVEQGGAVRCIHSEKIDLHAPGNPVIRQACTSSPMKMASGWLTFRPLLGPFATRSQVLEAENQWLQQHWLVPGG